jgi:hypothetical protein
MPAFGLCALSGAAGLLQFSKRGYFHYAMLVLPSAIITGGLAIYFGKRWLGEIMRSPWRAATPAIVVAAAAFAWFSIAGTRQFLQDASAQLTSPTRWTTDEMGTLAPVCSAVRPAESLLLIPPRDNRIHWLCRTRPMDLKFTHSWEAREPERYIPLLSAPSLHQVLVLAADRGGYERWYFREGDWPAFFRELDRLGFRQTLSARDGRLFQRTPP